MKKSLKNALIISGVTLTSITTGSMLATSLVNADAVSVSIGKPIVAPVSSSPVSADVTASNSTGTTLSAGDLQKHLQNIITKGNQEIDRRLATLNTLTAKINAATKLTPSDKSALTNEVSSTISGLTTLKIQLDGETTVAGALTDRGNIYSEYRVYALVAPKITLIKVADDQQVVEAKLSALAQKLQTRITADQKAGKDVTELQSELNSMNAQVSTSQSISTNIESSVINLQPSDYNSNHAVLEGDNTQLKTAHSDNLAANQDAKNIVASLMSL